MPETRSPKRGLRNSAVLQAMMLGAFAMVAAASLALANLGTRDAIAERKAEDLRASISQVVPAERHENNMLADVITVSGPDGAPKTVYQAMKDGSVSGVAFRMTGFGYAGAIDIIMGVAADGELMGVRVLSHAETPGLGDKIEAAKDDWILGFTGLSLGDPPAGQWAVKKDGGRFDQFSGATVTPRAVVKAIKEGLEFFAANRSELLQSPAPVSAGADVPEKGAGQ